MSADGYNSWDGEKLDEKDSGLIGIGVIASLGVFLVAVIYMQGVTIEKDREDNLNKLIPVSENSLGCTKYKYNSDYVWSCPESVKITQVETEKCTRSGNINTCTKTYEPVIKSAIHN